VIPPAVFDMPASAPPAPGGSQGADDSDEVSPDADTTPMAVILGGKSRDQQPATGPAGADDETAAPDVKRIRGPFEPPEKPEPVEPERPSSVATANAATRETTMSDAARASVWSPAAAKMDQIKDLYLTAEALGEDALDDQHFELVSDRQRQLIREYFDQPGGSRADSHDAAS
jgi:hypothetical protein